MNEADGGEGDGEGDGADTRGIWLRIEDRGGFDVDLEIDC